MAPTVTPANRDTANHDPLAAARREVVDRWARKKRNGKPQVCNPSKAERQGKTTTYPGSDGKIIFPDREAAETAANELLTLTSIAFRPYLCPRSKNRHHHLTSDVNRRGLTR